MGRRDRRTGLLGELPEAALFSGARVTLMGRTAVLVEGQKGVVELGNTCIRLRMAGGTLAICGAALRLEELSGDAAMIRGEVIESAGYG